MKKIVVIGPESTGKSTLSQALAQDLGAPWVPEYARAYLDGLGRPYREGDLMEIARGQLLSEDETTARASASGAPCIILDTDLYVIKVWSEHRYGRCDPWILQQIARRRYDLYLVTDIDLPWQADPQREHPDPRMREYFFKIYQDIARNASVPWALVKGEAQARVASAKAALVKLRLGG